jgi:L-fuconolactonase
MSGIPIVDTHVHFWEPERLAYPWLASVRPLLRSFVPGDYRSAFASAPIERMVFVECNVRADQCEQEVDWIESLVQDEPRLSAIVAFADLTVADEQQRTGLIERLLARPMVRGIRHNIQGQPKGFCLQPAFVAGVQTVHKLGAHFELCVTHDQLDDVIELLRRSRVGRFMINHGAKPSIRTDSFEPWKTQMAEIARFENVWCKISGLFTEADLTRQSVEVVRPYAEHLAACFGADRIVYGSDWPVCTLAAEGVRWLEFVHKLTAGWKESEQIRFYRDNALDFYGIGL